jgi:hypothetical protein
MCIMCYMSLWCESRFLDPEQHTTMELITIEQNLTFEVHPMRNLEDSERVMRNRTLKYVKVLWSQQFERGATWELESRMREKSPELFMASM